MNDAENLLYIQSLNPTDNFCCTYEKAEGVTAQYWVLLLKIKISQKNQREKGREKGRKECTVDQNRVISEFRLPIGKSLERIKNISMKENFIKNVLTSSMIQLVHICPLADC